MAKGDLKLKRELIASPAESPQGDKRVAQVWVDSSVYHLDSAFSYAIPGNLSEKISIGSLVSVPFHGRELLAAVIAIEDSQSLSGLKSISKIIGEIPFLSPAIISLIESASQRYASHPFDLIRSAIPDRIAKVEKEYRFTEQKTAPKSMPVVQQYLQLPPARSRSHLISEKIKKLLAVGSVLVILPDTKEVNNLHSELLHIGIPAAILDSQLPKSEYFKNFLDIRTGVAKVVIGTRSAIFAPLKDLASVIIYNEGSENFYERRAPGWNVRDMALLRRQQEHINLFFIGYSPSSEIARLIDEGWVESKKVKARVKTFTFSQIHNELIPSRAISVIKKAVTDGPVLFIVPSKGYAQAIRCAKCRTISRCECGGAHIKASQNAPISCNHCAQSIVQWQCQWCNHVIPTLQSRGIERHLHEIGLLFPGIPTQISSSDHLLTASATSGFFVATPGMAPECADGYSAVVILEGNRFLDQPDMRADERVREMYFAHSALARTGAPIIFIQDEAHPIATAIATWNPFTITQRDLEERLSLSLPPFVRAVMLTMEINEVTRLKNSLTTAREEGRLPESTKILGPIPSGEKAALILTVSVEDGGRLVSTIHEFMRRRSASKKPLPALRIDPYSLSR